MDHIVTVPQTATYRTRAARIAARVPRAGGYEQFGAEPLDFLARARAAHGDVFVVREGGPIFSRTRDCCGALAVFGSEGQRAVLSDIDTFAMPPSAAEQLKLPAKLAALNRSLHSMRGEEHAEQKRLIAGVLADNRMRDQHAMVVAALDAFVAGWQPGSTVGLLTEMRKLALHLAARVLFGERAAERGGLADLLHTYFMFRREASSPANAEGSVAPELLFTVGTVLDDALRAYVRECRRDRSDAASGLLGALAAHASLSEDQLVGHSNILFVSSTEPIAVALTWILLILSQRPALRAALRESLHAGTAEGGAASSRSYSGSLLEGVIHETLRLLPPNGFMARITTRETSIGGLPVPARCEIVLCPLIAHRDARAYERPDVFLPARWLCARPSPFDYFPFGAGGHACPGRGLALYLLKTAVSALIERFDVLLASDQSIDWRVHIMFMPRSDPTVRIFRADAEQTPTGGRLRGPVAELLRFTDRDISENAHRAPREP